MRAHEIDRYTGRKEATIDNVLIPWSVYEFRVSATNELGTGVPSAPSPQHATLTDKPYRAPANIGGGGGKIGDLTITWTPLRSEEQNGLGIHYKIFWRRSKHDTEFQSLVLKEYGNTGMSVVHISQKFYYTDYDVMVQVCNFNCLHTFSLCFPSPSCSYFIWWLVVSCTFWLISPYIYFEISIVWQVYLIR